MTIIKAGSVPRPPISEDGTYDADDEYPDGTRVRHGHDGTTVTKVDGRWVYDEDEPDDPYPGYRFSLFALNWDDLTIIGGES